MFPGDISNANDQTTKLIGSKATSLPPLEEDFDSYDNGTIVFPGLYNSGDIPFEVNDGETTSGSTGPNGDVNNDGKYIYMESSNSFPNATAIISTDCIDLTGSERCKIFFCISYVRSCYR